MIIVDINYEESRTLALKGLKAHFKEKYPDFEIDGNEDDSRLKPTRTFSFAITNKELIVGRIFGEVDTFNSAIRVDGLFVDSKARGTGAGSMLMKEAEKLGLSEKCHMCFVNTTQSIASGFYEKLGYKCIERIKNYPIEGAVYCYYFKRLS